MLYKFLKSFAAVMTAFTVVSMSAVVVFDRRIPDGFYCENHSTLSLPGLYGKLMKFDKPFKNTAPAISQTSDSYSVTVELFGIVPVKEVNVTVTDEKMLTVCGSPFGVKMFVDGVLVVGFSKIDSENGKVCPATDCGLLKGDLIKSVNGEEVFSNEDVAKHIENSGGNPVKIEIERNKNRMSISLFPAMLKDKSGYKAGFWVRDSSAGIGTLTFYDPDTMTFGGLGHAVCDIDTGGIIPFSSGEITPAAITKIKKGYAGAPGELSGAFTGDDMGKIKTNSEAGLYGKLDHEVEGFSAPVAHKQDVYEGPAVIYSTLEGTDVEEYDVEIEHIDLSDGSMTKNLIIRVTDEDLIELSGGIVQGMSGSPIVQDGKLIGAVTHVFVSDPTKGFGIFIENMLEAAG